MCFLHSDAQDDPSSIKTAEVTYSFEIIDGVRQNARKADLYFHPSPIPQSLVIVLFGGDIDQLHRASEDVVSICNALAQEGIAAAAIDYNTDFNFLGEPEKELYRSTLQAMADCEQAIEFFNSPLRLEDLVVDKENIYLCGISGGGIIALQTALYNRVDESSYRYTALMETELKESAIRKSNLKGVIGMFGGIVDLDMIDSSDPSLCLIHSKSDKHLPSDSGTFRYQGIETIPIYGGSTIHQKAEDNDLRSVYLDLGNVGHVPWSNNEAYLTQSIDFAVDFIKSEQRVLSVVEDRRTSVITFPNPVKSTLFIENHFEAPLYYEFIRLDGTIVYESVIKANDRGSLDIRNLGLAPANYWLKVQSGHYISVRPIIIN